MGPLQTTISSASSNNNQSILLAVPKLIDDVISKIRDRQTEFIAI